MRLRLAIARSPELLAQRDAPSSAVCVIVLTIVAAQQSERLFFHYHVRSGSPRRSRSSAIGYGWIVHTSRRRRTISLVLTERCLPPRSSVSPRSSSRPSRSVKHARSSLTDGSDQRLVLDDSLGHPPSLLPSHPFPVAPSTCSFSHFLHFCTSLECFARDLSRCSLEGRRWCAARNIGGKKVVTESFLERGTAEFSAGRCPTRYPFGLS